jgi:5-methyltetrahydrofolate--homocysteine methyltransferase
MVALEELREAVVEGYPDAAVVAMRQSLSKGIPAATLLQDGLIEAMHRVGQQYQEGEIFIPEMLVAAQALKAALAVLKPKLVDQGVTSRGIVAIGTVKGDLHDIGKNLVAMMLEGSGYEIRDLGVDVSPARFVQAVRDGAKVVAMSALLTTTMVNVSAVVDALVAAGLRGQARIIVGGAPVTEAFATEVGADAYASDGTGAVRLVNEMLQS